MTIRLNYRPPGGDRGDSTTTKKYLVDESAVILPRRKMWTWSDSSRTRSLIRIKGKGLVDPSIPSPGIAWKPRAGLTRHRRRERRIFRPPPGWPVSWRTRCVRIDKAEEPALNIRVDQPDGYADEYRGLFLWNAESTYILWGEAPGEESPGSLTPRKNGKSCANGVERERNRSVPDCRTYWEITAGGLVHDDHERRRPGIGADDPARQGSCDHSDEGSGTMSRDAVPL